MMQNLFVTGTDTDIGKTVVSTVLAVGLNADYWKPIQTGTDTGEDSHAGEDAQTSSERGSTDSSFVSKWIGEGRVHREAYTFSPPISPHLAAARAKTQIEISQIQRRYEEIKKQVVIEGAGGLLVPLNSHETMLSLIEALRIPVILVLSTRLGTINHSLLSIEALNQRELDLHGFISVGSESNEVVKTIETFSGARNLGHVSHCEEFHLEWFRNSFSNLDLLNLETINVR